MWSNTDPAILLSTFLRARPYWARRSQRKPAISHRIRLLLAWVNREARFVPIAHTIVIDVGAYWSKKNRVDDSGQTLYKVDKAMLALPLVIFIPRLISPTYHFKSKTITVHWSGFLFIAVCISTCTYTHTETLFPYLTHKINTLTL